jgi:S-adenosylmethionine synthetase
VEDGLMRQIRVDTLPGVPVGDLQVEMVERKGVGHPDSICDAIMDRVSVELCKEYLSQFGRILHHNIDKAFLVAGEAEVRFGGGKIIEPMRLIFGDRATYGVNGREIPIREIAINTAARTSPTSWRSSPARRSLWTSSTAPRSGPTTPRPRSVTGR